MQFKHLSLAALASTASAQSMMNLTAALGSNPDLSSLTTAVAANPQLLSMLSNATNITILAPSNMAFSKMSNGSMGVMTNNTNMVQALLMYHVLNGTHSASSIGNMTSFIPTMLNNPMYSNVTGGQRVEALMTGKNVTFFSGLQGNSSVTQAVCFTAAFPPVVYPTLTRVPRRI